jgi:hypothetical protein
MNRAAVKQAIAEACLPARVKNYLLSFAVSPGASELRRLLKADPVRLLDNIARVLDGAAVTLGVSREEVLFATGFHPGNLAPDRFEAALAELKAVAFLAGAGFSSIELVSQTRSRTADITAAKGKNTYAFEVRCVTGAGAEKDLFLLEKKYRKKMPQAACSRKKGGLTHCGLVLVINAGDFSPFSESRELEELAAALHKIVGSPARRHLCLMSGGAAGVFPAWGA